MKLKTLIERCGCLTFDGKGNPEITMVCTDSREVREGGLFVAIEGYRDNGLRYIEDAVKRGAAALVVEERFKNQARGYLAAAQEAGAVPRPQTASPHRGEGNPGETLPALCVTPDARRCALFASREFYDRPSKSLTLVGVTGTNGKTTITYLIEAILRAAGKNPGVVGTISYRFNDVTHKADNTTPDPVELQSFFARMRDGGVTHAVMEVSSHALAMDRVHAPDFDAAVFTNLTQDHLDFHKTMDGYFRAKALLFQGLDAGASAIINRDDPHGVKLLTLTKARATTYSIRSKADLKAELLDLSIEGTRFRVNGKEFFTRLVGEHNVYNFLAAYGVARALGFDDGTVERALVAMKNVPGRFERVGAGRGCHVFVDYAHTPDALERLLEAANRLGKGRIITVFGCGGDRDRGKRPLMGGVVERMSDVAVVTSDNPRTEDPLAVIEDITRGLEKDNHLIIPDRRAAIFHAVELARPGDIVLIAGKGHEDYQILKDRTIHFDDRKVAAEAMRETGKW